MTPPPRDLLVLRERAAASYGWWHKGARVSDQTRLVMTDQERAGCQWRPDLDLIEELCHAERAFTDTLLTERDGR